MTDDQRPSPKSHHDFDDLLEEIDSEASFAWDEELDADDEEEEGRPVVCFRIGQELFAVAGDAVREIVSSTEITALPGAPPHVRGVTVVRRQVVGLLSLRTFLELDDSPDNRTPRRTLIVDTAHYTVGLRVDEVTGLEHWPESRLDPSTLPDNLRPSTRRYARGTHIQGDEVCLYLDLETLLDDAAVQ